MKDSKLECPLCKSTMRGEDLPSENEQEVTHLWWCNDCPGMVIEYWDGNDRDAFLKFLDKKGW